ncbi:MAG: DNA gyrase subunit A [Deltaproteobacteria bacterium]|nr:DNA gyrase subunit A [Deltaproteobacteria bacterium]
MNIEQELKKSYLEYALSVIVGRAIPDVRDGLKPVHRRILYAMHDLGNTYNRPYKKSARVVGDVIGKYHPHGDSAVYDALVRLAQNFNMRDPLIDGQGNFGSIDGDSAAAMRYTEARMSRLTTNFLEDIDKDTVQFRPNYDNTLQEPSVLPTKVPNLLVNGSSGIAVGMATNIPPHNLGEVVDATLLLLNRPEASIRELMALVQGPDFPTGAFLFNRRGIRDAYETGRGNVMIRSRLEVKERKNGQESIIVNEIPYAVNKSVLVEKIAALVNEQRLEGISDLRDESDRNGIRIVMDLKRGVNSAVLVNQLYKYTQLQTSFGINMMAVVNNRPKLLNLKEILEHFIAFRKEVIVRRSRFELAKAEHRAHILEGLRVALDNIDEVVSIIRSSAGPAEAKARLTERFGLSDIQSQAILDMRLQRLTGLEREKLLEEYKELLKRIEYLKSVIENQEVLKSVIQGELEELKRSFATPRRSLLLDHDPGSIDIEDIIPDDEVVITMSRQGYIKRASLDIYQQQKKGGKGKAGVNVSDKDFITSIIISSNHQYLYFFTSRGRTYQTKAHQIPEGSRIAKGTHIANILPLEQDEYVATILSQRDMSEEKSFLFVTKKGMVKKSAMNLYRNIRSSGLIAVGLREEDELLAVRETGEDDEVILVTREGYSIRFRSGEIRDTGRSASGVKGITLRPGDEVVTGVVVTESGKKELLTIAEHGLGKRTHLEQYRGQSRGGKGIINMRVTPRTGRVVGAMMVDSEDEVILLTSGHKIIRIGIAEVSLVGRATQGVKLVQLDDDQKVVCFDRVVMGEDKNGDEVF